VGDITVSSSNSQASSSLNFLIQTFSKLIVNKSKFETFSSVNSIICYWFEMVHLFCLIQMLCKKYQCLRFSDTVNFAVGPYWASFICHGHCSASLMIFFKKRSLHSNYNLVCHIFIEDLSAVDPYWELCGCPWRGRCTHRTVYSGRSRGLGVSEYTDGRDRCTLCVQNQSIVLISKQRIGCCTLLTVKCILAVVVNNYCTYLSLCVYLYMLLGCVLNLFNQQWYRYALNNDLHFARREINWFVTRIFYVRLFLVVYIQINISFFFGLNIWSKSIKSDGKNITCESVINLFLQYTTTFLILNGWLHEIAESIVVLCVIELHLMNVRELVMLIINKCFRICNPSLVSRCERITVPLSCGGHHWVRFVDLPGMTYVPPLLNGR